VAKESSSTVRQRTQAILTGTVLGVVAVALLYWARVVFVPLALGVFRTFLLSPLVLLLQRRGLGCALSILVVVTLAALVPVGIGWEATRQIKADPATQAVPVIALTAHAMAGDREKALGVGCADYHTKPVHVPCLLTQIEALLSNRAM